VTLQLIFEHVLSVQTRSSQQVFIHGQRRRVAYRSKLKDHQRQVHVKKVIHADHDRIRRVD
jgi:hypothetical protein